jgi:hypothetical protein
MPSSKILISREAFFLSARSRFSISSFLLDPESEPFLPQHMIPGAMPVATGEEKEETKEARGAWGGGWPRFRWRS